MRHHRSPGHRRGDLATAKRLVITRLAGKYPAWFADYSVTDRNTWAKRIAGTRAIVENEALARRPDIRGLAEYLRARDAVMAVLAARESHGLTASSNQDIALAWASIMAQIVERNPAFADLWYRKLENDPVEPDSLAAAG